MKIESAERPGMEFEKEVAAEIARLKAEGYSKAYICERSFDIEDAIQCRVARTAQQGDLL
ncbi:hypothetical protein WMC41_31140 (plasmid) [Shinella yambaruensis]|uniref:hypothetical protein n=1 Tax=Shinella TaxID=323620 RepID=UPI002586D93B|nr:hypothetical protein [Shinella sp.]MCW5712354.1 hypothetical protein [Shinella sp.]